MAVHLCRGQYTGTEPERLAVLKCAAALGAQFIDVEHLAAKAFFASECLSLLAPLQCLAPAFQTGENFYIL